MVRIAIIGILAVILLGCRNTVVISSDGTEELGYCMNASTCIQKYCPGNEASTVKPVSDGTPSDDIIRCTKSKEGK